MASGYIHGLTKICLNNAVCNFTESAQPEVGWAGMKLVIAAAWQLAPHLLQIALECPPPGPLRPCRRPT